MEHKLGSAWGIYKETWMLYKQYLNAIVLLASIPAVVFILLQLLTAYEANPLLLLGAAVGYFVVTVVSVLTLAVVIIGDVGSFKEAYKRSTLLIVSVVVIGILATLAVLGGTILLVIPGIYIGILFSLWAYALINENKRGINALVHSWYLVKGYWWSVLRKQLFLLLGTLVPMAVFALVFGAIAFLVAGPGIFQSVPGEASIFQTMSDELFSLYIAGPLSLLFGKIVYRRIKANKPGEFSPEEAAKVKRNIMLLAALSIAVVLIFLVLTLFGLWTLFQFLETLPTVSSMK